MPPITKTSDEVIKEAIKEASKRTADEIYEKINTVSTGGSKISQILKTANKPQSDEEKEKEKELEKEKEWLKEKQKEREEKEKLEKEKELLKEKEKQKEKELEQFEKEKEKMIKERLKDKEDYETEKEKLLKQLEEEEVFCPTCHKGHVHVLKGVSPGKVKCTGDGCGTEYNLIPDDADYKCEHCGIPKKKPATTVSDDKCPFCGGDKFKKFDWTKIKKKYGSKK